MGFGLVIKWVMFSTEDILPLIDQSAQDIQQVERGELSSMTVSFSKKTHEYGMPGPYRITYTDNLKLVVEIEQVPK